ncbi:C-type lectin protein [Halenospora varia]|nr:C-type lectin protein [Halenospora varia]
MTIPSASSGAVEVVVVASKAAQVVDAAATHKSSQKSEDVSDIDIIDIRHDALEINLKEEILNSLRPVKGPKTLPTLLLYDERGLQLFEEITYLDEYYLTNAEIDVLKRSADSIAKTIPKGSMLIELGSGNLRKVSVLLQALENAAKDVDYYALDLSMKELRRTLEQVPNFQHVRCHGLHGTYDDGLDWLKAPENSSRTKCVMTLGSSIGNFHRNEAAEFLRGFSEALQTSEDSLLVGLDATSDSEKVFHAYNDHVGTTHKFILNGLTNANSILGEDAFNIDDWKVIGEYVYDSAGGRHQAFYSPKKDLNINGIHFKAEERIQVEQSLKYSSKEARKLWKDSGLREVSRWATSTEAYNIHLLKKDVMAFDSAPAVYAASTIPILEDWKELWRVWDVVTRGMIPDDNLLEKPIKLRNACIFYIGHIPTFLDIQLNKVTQEPPCEPASYQKIFERGIDPDVDNPEHCHAHSEIPDHYPPLEEILEYQNLVRAKVQKLYANPIPRDVGRALWIGHEHEIMHLETLLYMLLQSDKTRPPTISAPDFEAIAKVAETARVPNQWFDIPQQKLVIGLDDPEDNSGPDRHFGWDNEKPPRNVEVHAFQAKARPITNEDYARYLEQTHSLIIPASWTEDNKTNISSNGYVNGYTNGHTNGANGHGESSIPLTQAFLDGKSVRTVYGMVPLKYALDWPVFASYDELAGCAAWMGGRIPTVEEARSIYSHVDGLKIKEAEQHLGKTVPAVNGHLVNNGVQESPPSRASHNGESSEELFTNLEGANVGFKNWHPVAVTANGNKLAGQADMGGVWEWTSSVLAKHEGFEPMRLYPAYTADFFDGKHNIVLGGSWSTLPRIAGRKTFVNWYQRNYPYAWAGARIVRDI